ncbi:MAG TPA: glycosyltransferase family 9 protein [Methanosarcina sp.]|nr:glycosyltransferase family 9 protein [Methanosarcina sp.]
MTTGVIRELKQKFGKNANIDVATDYQEAYRNNPHIRNIFAVDMVGRFIQNYHHYINLDNAYEANPLNHYVDSYFYRAFGAHHEMNQSVELFPDDNDMAKVDADLKEIGKKFIVVHLRNWHWTAKNISMEVWFDVFAQIFGERTDFKVVTVGGQTDHYIEGHPLFFDARDRYNNQQLKYLCDHAACFVGVDSGPFQCAAASKTHIIALLTHLKPERILPYRCWERGYNCTAIQTREDCAGCNDVQERPVRQLVCSKQNTPCVNNFDATAISQEILKQLGK